MSQTDGMPAAGPSARSIYVQIDNTVSNPVLSAGPEQHETKEVPLSKLEQFFVDVHNVFLEENTSKETSSIEDDSDLRRTLDPLAEADQFIHMAKYQMDNLVQLIDTVLNRSGLTISHVAHQSRQPPTEDMQLMVLRAKRAHLKSSSEILLKGAESIRDSFRISRTSVGDLNKIGRFFHIVLNPNRGIAVNISLKHSKPALIPLVQLEDGHFATQGGKPLNLSADLISKFHSGLYRLVYDSISTLSSSKSIRMHRRADRIEWKGAHSTIEIFPDLKVSGTVFSEAISVRLLSYHLSDLRKRNVEDRSHPSSRHAHLEMEFIEHEHICRSLSYLFFRLTSSYRHVLTVRDLYSDSLLHSGWSVCFRNFFMAEVIVERTDIVVRCLSAYPYSAYEARCCNVSLVEHVLLNAIHQRL